MSVIQSVLSTIGVHTLRIDAVVDLAPGFRRLDLRGPTLAGATINAGDKVQLRTNGVMRTYSPFAVRGADGGFSVVGFVHGDGSTPGARFIKGCAVGDHVTGFVRASIRVDDDAGAVVVVGDETSIGVAAAIVGAHRRLTARAILAVDHVSVVNTVVASLGGVDAARVFVIENDVGVVDSAVRAAIDTAGADVVTLVLTGAAPRIQLLRASLKARPATRGVLRQKVKAYWAPGKRGLD